jgi:hypothetical protein
MPQEYPHMLGQAVEALAHIHRHGRQPDLNITGSDHDAPSIARTSSTIRSTAIAGSRSILPPRNSMEIPSVPATAGAFTTIGTKAAFGLPALLAAASRRAAPTATSK